MHNEAKSKCLLSTKNIMKIANNSLKLWIVLNVQNHTRLWSLKCQQ